MCLLCRLFCRHSLIYGNSGSFSGSSPNNIYIHRLIHNQNTQLSLKAVSVHYYILLQYYSSSTLLYIHTFYTFRTLRFFDVSPPLRKKGDSDVLPQPRAYSTHTQTHTQYITHKYSHLWQDILAKDAIEETFKEFTGETALFITNLRV